MSKIHGFRIIPPQSVEPDVLQYYNKLAENESLKMQPLMHFKELSYAVVHTERRVDFSVFHASRCIGYVSFGKVDEPVLSEIVPDLVKPHAQIIHEYQRHGITRTFYLTMIENGYSLVTESHTYAASILWANISRVAKAPIHNWDRHALQWVPHITDKTLKVLTTKKIPI
jgi:hypothetical protein